MGLTIYIIVFALFLAYQFFTKGSTGFKQWWKELGSLPMAMMHGALVVISSMNIISRYRLVGFDQNAILWIVVTLVWLILTIFDFVKLYQQKQNRFLCIACLCNVVLFVAMFLS